jgi:hypothetical protein
MEWDHPPPRVRGPEDGPVADPFAEIFGFSWREHFVVENPNLHRIMGFPGRHPADNNLDEDQSSG